MSRTNVMQYMTYTDLLSDFCDGYEYPTQSDLAFQELKSLKFKPHQTRH
jgi:hypothetical protein